MRRSLPLLFASLCPLGAPVAAQPMPDPAAAPPSPARLDGAPSRPVPVAAMPSRPVAGLESLPAGGWRLRFEAGVEQPVAAASGPLAELGGLLAGEKLGRVIVLAQASGPKADVSAARRLTLARAEAVKQALAVGGLDVTRIDLRPLGRTPDGIDAVDILPPPERAG